MTRAACAALLIAALASTRAIAAEPHPLHYDLRVDGTVTVAATAAWVASELAKSALAPSRCRICGTNALDAGARDLLVWGHGDRARSASNLLAFAIVPGGVVAHQLLAARAAGDVESGLVDLLLVAEATALALDLDQAVKYATGRQRPFVHYGDWADPDRKPQPDDNLSFYSGHTALAFSLAAGAGTISTMRGYRSAPWVWGVGMSLASVVGYLRIAGDMHYLTDVLAGAALGGAIGFAVPWCAHRRDEGRGVSGTTVVPVPLGVVVVF